METLDKTLEYHELLMVLNDFNITNKYFLPDGFSFVFYNGESDIEDWIKIHMESGEFASYEYAKKVFYQFYGSFIQELPKRCFFVIDNKTKEKVATSTVSISDDNEYDCVVDWLAIKKSYQGYKLARPLIEKTIFVARDLGYDKIMLHTQTHTWLAAKLYLDMGFIPFMIYKDIKGWQILKTLINHAKLKNISAIEEKEIYFLDAVNIVKELNKKHKNFEYQIWHKNSMNDVWVNENNILFKYKYFNKGKDLKLISKCVQNKDKCFES